MARAFDLCIVGGGIIGCATAYYAARAGLSVVLCERGTLAGEASGLNPGTVALATKAPGEHVLMARASMAELARLDAALGHCFDYVRAGSLVIFEDADERAFAVDHAAALRGHGVEITVIDAAEARRIQPILEGPIAGALWSPRDVLVGSRALTLALAQAARTAGADLREGTAIGAFVRNGEAWDVVAGETSLRARWLVNAAGVGAPAVGARVGLDHPIAPRKGQLMATTPIPDVAPVRVTSVQELLRKQGRPVRAHAGPPVEVGLTPQPGGVVFLGGTQEMVGLDATLDPPTLGTIAMRAVRLFPRLGEAAIVRAWSGFRPFAPGGRPIVGAVASVPGYVVAGGHGGDGVALAPITGRYVADLVRRGGRAPAFADYAAGLADGSDAGAAAAR
ncbi:MAG: FAD-binding oxidoreductase [Alphaproteobacteria bacterium]|nr:FAD-binding oxidoreductase [Alphaproteobacteria bacterium]